MSPLFYGCLTGFPIYERRVVRRHEPGNDNSLRNDDIAAFCPTRKTRIRFGAAYEVGFNDPKYFSRVFSELFGMAPSEVKKN